MGTSSQITVAICWEIFLFKAVGSAVYIYCIFFIDPYKIGIVILSTLLVTKLQFSKGEQLAEYHIACKMESWGFNSDLSDTRANTDRLYLFIHSVFMKHLLCDWHFSRRWEVSHEQKKFESDAKDHTWEVDYK